MRICKPAVAALVWTGIACSSHALDSKLDEQNFWVKARYNSPAELQAIASQFSHLIVDQKNRTAQFDASSLDIAALRSAGISVSIDYARSEQMLVNEKAAFGASRAKSISGFACYRTVEETYTTMNQLASSFPNLAQVVDIGPSFEKQRNPSLGYTMKALVLGNRNNDASVPIKPNMVVLSSIHAREYTPAELMTRFAEWLVNNYGVDPEATWLMDHNRFHFVLQANPDGRKKAETGISWRKNTNNTNGSCSANRVGTDLNRNFTFHWNTAAGGSSPDPCNDTYRGPTAASEAETQNIIRYVAGTLGSNGVYTGGVLADQRADAVSSAAPSNYRGMFLDIHSFSQLVLWPWGDTTAAAPNGPALRTLGRRMAYFNGYRPQQSDELYATDGATDDNFYGSLGAPSFTIELGVAFFESCSTFESTTLPKNLAAMKYAARVANAPYQLPGGPNTVSVAASASSVQQGSNLTITASVDDSQFQQTNGTEATQTITGAKVYVDQIPWQSGAVGTAMSAVDGSFSSNKESVRATIATTGLSLGVHTFFVQAVDSSGALGAPNAVHVNITSGTTPPGASFSNSQVFNIADNATIESPITVSGVTGNAPTALKVPVNITHTYQGDLKLDLIAPNGTIFNLWNRTGAGTDNIVQTFTVNASGVVANGVWKLRVNDNASGDTGKLNSWGLQF
jgi:carboxypeptidase T